MDHQVLLKLPSVFSLNLCTSPHPIITFLSQTPHSWPGLVLINFLSSPLPSLQSFLLTNLGWCFQNAHTTNCFSQLQLWFKAFSVCHCPQDKDQSKAPKTLTLLLHPPSSLATFSLTLRAPGCWSFSVLFHLLESLFLFCCSLLPNHPPDS